MVYNTRAFERASAIQGGPLNYAELSTGLVKIIHNLRPFSDPTKLSIHKQETPPPALLHNQTPTTNLVLPHTTHRPRPPTHPPSSTFLSRRGFIQQLITCSPPPPTLACQPALCWLCVALVMRETGLIDEATRKEGNGQWNLTQHKEWI